MKTKGELPPKMDRKGAEKKMTRDSGSFRSNQKSTMAQIWSVLCAYTSLVVLFL